MYFIRYKPLKEKLKARTLSDREALPYLIFYAGLAAAIHLIPAMNEFNRWDWMGGVLSVSLAVGGVIYAYTQNGGKDGFDLIQKYVVIGWIAAVRCILVFFPIAIVLYFLGERLGVITDETGWFDVLVNSVFETVLYQRIGRHMRDVR